MSNTFFPPRSAASHTTHGAHCIATLATTPPQTQPTRVPPRSPQKAPEHFARLAGLKHFRCASALSRIRAESPEISRTPHPGGWYWSNVVSNGLRRRADGLSASAGGVRLARSRRVLPLVRTNRCVPWLLETWTTHGIYCVTTLKPIRAAASDAAELPCPRQVLRANIVGWDK